MAASNAAMPFSLMPARCSPRWAKGRAVSQSGRLCSGANLHDRVDLDGRAQRQHRHADLARPGEHAAQPRVDEQAREHIAVLEAIARGDAPAARDAIAATGFRGPAADAAFDRCLAYGVDLGAHANTLAEAAALVSAAAQAQRSVGGHAHGEAQAAAIGCGAGAGLQREAQLAAFAKERAALETRVQSLRDGSLQRDMVDERARRALNMGNEDEIVILR